MPEPTDAMRERAAIVAYLRAEERMVNIRRPRLASAEQAYANAISNMIDAIEAGEHDFPAIERLRLGPVGEEG